MPEIYVGGAPVAEAELTRSWGLTPGSGNITMPGSVTGMCGTDITVNLGGAVFFGVVTDDAVETTSPRGVMTKLQVADNRIKLQWDDIYCAFNMVEVREDNPDTPGIDRQKRYWHILPDDWDSQTKSWTDTPYTAQQIITMILVADTVSYPWTAVFYSAQSAPVYGIDANQGTTKLGTLLQEITEHQGLVFTLTDEYELTWCQKGQGEIPDFPANSSETKLGEALNANDTNIRVVGDRNRYEDMPVELDVDWLPIYEQFWAEPAWIAEVEAVFGPFTDDMSGRASLAAKSRSVTVRDYYNAKTAGGAAQGIYDDHGMWGEVCRLEIPAWIYINDIVFKAYRVSYDYTVNGIDLDSIEMVEGGLLAAVDHDINTGVISLKDPREYYPDTKAYVIVQGQQLDLLDPRTQTIITAEQLAAAATIWTASNKFNLDIKNKVIIFEHAVFVPGAGAAALFIFPNRAIEGIEDTDPLYNIAVPNVNATFAHAAVQAALVWDAEKYSKQYGSGVRKGGKYARGLNYHALMDEGVFTEEVDYADGEGADQKSEEFAAALIAQAPTYPSGEYKRIGATGTALSSMIDRVTMHLNFAEGLSETVFLTKEKPGPFENDRQLDRRQRGHDLFPGQSALRENVKTLELIAKVTKGVKRNSPTDYTSLSHVITKPIGAIETSPTTFDDTVNTWPAGQPVFVDDTGAPASAGTIFKGIVIADQSTGKGIAAATQGTVPVRARSHFTIAVTSDSILSKLAETLLGCGGTPGSQTTPDNVDLAMEIKPGMMLYSIPSSGQNYVTAFDLYSVFHAIVQTILADISASIAGAFTLPMPDLPPVEILDGSASVSPPTTSIPSLSISFPALSFEDFDPCKPLSSGAAAATDAFSSYDFSSAFADVQALIATMDCAFAASVALPNINGDALEAALLAAVQSLLCSLATVVDDVISNLDKILQLLEAIITDYLTRMPVGIARGHLTTDVTDTVLLPVDLVGSRGDEINFIKELSDSLFSVLKDIPLFGIAPARTVADLLNSVIPLVLNSISGVMTATSTEINTAIAGVAAGVEGALLTAKSAAAEVVGIIQSEHAQVQSMLSSYATYNASIADAAEQYMLKLAVTGANLIINYLKAPYIAAPKVYLLASPYAGLDLLTDATDFCDLATKLTTLATALAAATPPGLPDLSTASYIDDQNLQLGTGDNAIALRTADVDGKGPVWFQEQDYCNPDDPDTSYKILVLSSAPYPG